MTQQWSEAPAFEIDAAKTYTATLDTSHGTIELALDPTRAPTTVNNFVFLARQGFYDGVVFHRSIPGFVIQGGDPEGSGRGGPGYRFRDELDQPGSYSRGTLAMANAGPNTNGSQFFICLGEVGLPHQYTIFGTTTAGIEVVDAIAAVPTDRNDRPTTDCVIKSVTISES